MKIVKIEKMLKVTVEVSLASRVKDMEELDERFPGYWITSSGPKRLPDDKGYDLETTVAVLEVPLER